LSLFLLVLLLSMVLSVVCLSSFSSFVNGIVCCLSFFLFFFCQWYCLLSVFLLSLLLSMVLSVVCLSSFSSFVFGLVCSLSFFFFFFCQWYCLLSVFLRIMISDYPFGVFSYITFSKYKCLHSDKITLTGIPLFVGLMVLNATFNNISVISWRSVLLVEETGGPGENHRPVASHWQTLSHNVVHPALIEIRTHNIRGDRHWLHM
jgi:hypothetical protein